MSEIHVAIQILAHGKGLDLPRYETAGAAGADLRAAIEADLVLQPGARALVPSGMRFSIPEGYEMQVRPRSGLAARQGVTVLNTPGTVDSDYRGEVMVILINLGDRPVTIARGDRIAQIVLAPVTRGVFVDAGDLGETLRGGGGFGSTGR